MNAGILAAAIFSAVALGTYRAAPGAQALPPSQAGRSSSEWRSVRAGVFTEAQDTRGAAVYSRECSTCHGERLKGGEGAPALTGPEFSANWNGQAVGDLLERIRQTMPAPPEQPGKLSPQQNADVVAHILSVNGFPPGAAELPSDIEQLKRIRIDASKQ
jgi:mono/diheme cytochrome c family protein